jgi:hypothetical protein
MRKLGLLLATLVILIGVFAADSALAQATGTTNISVQLSPLAILYYRTALTLTVSGNDLATAIAGANPVGEAAVSPALTGTSGNLAGDATTAPTPFNAATILTTLSNFYQVRSTRSFQVTVSIPSGFNVLTATGFGTITMSTPLTSLDGSTFNATVNSTGSPTLGTPYPGWVRFTMDVTNVSNLISTQTYTGGRIQVDLATP